MEEQEREREHQDQQQHEEQEQDQHEDWRIALYYYYIEISDVPAHIQFHKSLCEKHGFCGRIRVSVEGINGVLSGDYGKLQEYEAAFRLELAKNGGGADDETHDGHDDNTRSASIPPCSDLDIKYCHLRPDLPIKDQLFDTLMVKETKSVISLFDHDLHHPSDSDGRRQSNGRSKQSGRRRRRKEHKQNDQQRQQHDETLHNNDGNDQSQKSTAGIPAFSPTLSQDLLKVEPAPHLNAEEWNERLQSHVRNENGKESDTTSSAILLDVRNCYESRVGHFAVPNVPTLLTNTRKYSDLPTMLATHPEIQGKEEVFMYCTGGVRCERVSMMMQTLYPEKKFYQLQGGIQTYLKDTAEDHNLYLGKNFVFDPRRTDPVHFGTMVGKCIVCEQPHDDYDNGHAPSEGKEARCVCCRMLILVCNDCRPKFCCFGEETDKADNDRQTTATISKNNSNGSNIADGDNGSVSLNGGEIDGIPRPPLFCGYPRSTCIHEGAAPKPEVVRIHEKI